MHLEKAKAEPETCDHSGTLEKDTDGTNKGKAGYYTMTIFSSGDCAEEGGYWLIPVCNLCGEPITEMYDDEDDPWQYIGTDGALYTLTENNELPADLTTENLSSDATTITYGGTISVGVYGADDWEALQAGTKTLTECTDASDSLPTHTAVAYRVYAYTSDDDEPIYAYSAVLIERDPFILMGEDKKTYEYGYGDDGRYALPNISLFVDADNSCSLYTDEGNTLAVQSPSTMSDYLASVFEGRKCSDDPVLVGYVECGICDHYIAIYASAEHTVASGTSVSATCGTAGYITGECANPADSSEYGTAITDGAYKGMYEATPNKVAVPDESGQTVKPANADGSAYFSNPEGVTTNTGADGNPIEFDWSEMAVERVEMEWVNLTTESGKYKEGYVLATVYYLTDEWAESFDEAYSGQLENETGDVITGWCDMYIVEATDEQGNTSYYLYGWAYNVAYDGGAEPYYAGYVFTYEAFATLTADNTADTQAVFDIAEAFNSEKWEAGDISDGITSTNYGFSWYKEENDKTYCGVSTLERVHITFTRVAVEGEEAYGDGTSAATYSFTVTLDFVTSDGDGKHQVTAELTKLIGTGDEKDATVGNTIYPDDVELLYNETDGLYYLDGNGNKVTVDFGEETLFTDEGNTLAVQSPSTMSEYLFSVFIYSEDGTSGSGVDPYENAGFGTKYGEDGEEGTSYNGTSVYTYALGLQALIESGEAGDAVVIYSADGDTYCIEADETGEIVPWYAGYVHMRSPRHSRLSPPKFLRTTRPCSA